MNKKILILAGKPSGIEVLDFLKKFPELSINIWSSNKELVSSKNYIKYLNNKKDFVNHFKKSKIIYDFVVLVHWPWLVPENLFKKFKDSINFHPAYLPIGRGWYPHVHAIINNLKWGVTLHQILPGMDDGDVWCQKKIQFDNFSNATELYLKSKNEMLKLFKQNFVKIISGKISAKKQNKKIITFHKKDLLKYDELKLSKKYKLEDLIKISNARSFKKKTFNYFYYKNKRYSFNILIKQIRN